MFVFLLRLSFRYRIKCGRTAGDVAVSVAQRKRYRPVVVSCCSGVAEVKSKAHGSVVVPTAEFALRTNRAILLS